MYSLRQKCFEFRIGGTVKIQVKIYSPVSTGEPTPRPTYTATADRLDKIRYENLSYSDLQPLLKLLRPHHLLAQPDTGATLVSLGKLRIDTQQASNVYRNIDLKLDDLSYGVVTIEHGAELCDVIGYEQKLLKYVKKGLIRSWKKVQVFNIHVMVATKYTPDSRYIEVKTISLNMVLEVSRIMKNRLKNRKNQVIARRLALEKNMNKIADGEEIVAKIQTSVMQDIERMNGKEAAEVVAKKVSVVSTFIEFFSAQKLLENGDISGAFAGVLADISSPGMVASAVFDVTLLEGYITALKRMKDNQIRLQNNEIAELNDQNRLIRWELTQILPESPIYGCGNSGYFDESDLANVDDIIKIHVRSGDLIDGIQVEYRHSGKAKHHGGHGGFLHTLSLGQNERIIYVGGTIYGHNTKWKQLSSLKFETDCGKTVQFGEPGGKDVFSFEMTDGSYLAAIKGFDLYPGNTEIYPGWDEAFRLLPAIGFIPKF